MTIKTIRAGLLAGVAVVALNVAAPQSARADMYTTAPGWYVALDGRYLFDKGDKTVFGPLKEEYDNGWGGKLTAGYRFANNWDVGLGFAANAMGKGKGNFFYSNGGGTTVAAGMTTKVSYQTVDFEAGYNMAIGTGSNLRLFGGIRAAHFNGNDRASLFVTGPTTISVGIKRKTTFWGAGPRIGVDGLFALGEGGFHLFGGLSGALLLGKSKSKFTAAGTIGGAPTAAATTDSKSAVFPQIDAELGLGYGFNSGGGVLSLQAGVRGDAWFGVKDKSDISSGTRKSGDYMNWGPFVRVSWRAAGGAPVAAVAPPPPAVMAKTYIVFFDWDRSTLTPDAIKTIADAAAASKTGGVQRVNVTGHADRSGSDQYNMALSLRRAGAVKDQLVRNGVPANQIVVVGRGESQPLVPTADGVREPQNRRVEIVLQ